MTKVWHKGRIILRENSGEVSKSQELWDMLNNLDFTFQAGIHVLEGVFKGGS